MYDVAPLTHMDALYLPILMSLYGASKQQNRLLYLHCHESCRGAQRINSNEPSSVSCHHQIGYKGAEAEACHLLLEPRQARAVDSCIVQMPLLHVIAYP